MYVRWRVHTCDGRESSCATVELSTARHFGHQNIAGGGTLCDVQRSLIMSRETLLVADVTDLHMACGTACTCAAIRASLTHCALNCMSHLHAPGLGEQPTF